jgi:hypothetical protein
MLGLPVALLAGYGADAMLELRATQAGRYGRIATAAGMIVVTAAGWMALVRGGWVLEAAFPEHAKLAAQGLPMALVHVGAVLLALATIGFLANRVSSRVVSSMVVTTVAVDLFVASTAALPMAPRWILEKPPRLIQDIRAELSVGRFYRDSGPADYSIPPLVGPAWKAAAWRLQTLSFSAAETFLVPMVFEMDIADLCEQRMARLRRAADEVDWNEMASLFQVAAVELVLSPQPPPINGLELAREYVFNDGPSLFLYRVTPGPTVARWVGSGRTAASPEEALGMLVAPDFDPSVEVIREVDTANRAGKLGPMAFFQPKVEISRQAISAPMAGYISTAIPWHPDLAIRVDGRPVPVERVNYAFAGVEVGPGRHNVVITFAPRMVLYGGIATASSIVIWVFFAVVLWRSRGGRLSQTSAESSRVNSPRST